MAKIDAFIFDLYGTLVDIHTDESRLSVWRHFSSYLQQYGHNGDPKTLRKQYFDLVRKLELEKGNPNSEIEIGEVFGFLLQECGIIADSTSIQETAKTFRSLSRKHLRVYAHGHELLRSLKGCDKKVYLLSNAQELFTIPELRQTGLYDLFDGIVISSKIGYKKPGSEIFSYLFRNYQLDAGRCMMIGNDPFCDILPAQDIGLKTAFICSALSPKKECAVDPDIYLDKMDLRKLWHILKSKYL